jgi:hypothetical protein
MKRYYILPRAIWEEPIHIGSETLPRHWLCSGAGGYVELSDGYILFNTDFTSDWAEEEWHSHPEIARLSHPIMEATLPLAHLHQHPQHAHKQFKRHHHEKLQSLLAISELPPIDDTHTLWDLHDRLIGKYPGLRLTRY